MIKLAGGIALLLLALFMVVGFLGAELDAPGLAVAIAAAVGIGLPAAGGVALLASHFGAGRGRARSRAELRLRTVEAEILKLAGRQAGRLTAVEVATELALSPEEAREVMEGLMVRGQADMAVTDSGVLVYTFHDVQHLDEKADARGILDA